MKPATTLRTLNIVNKVEGIAARLQVNIAYDVAPGATYHDARQFEIDLENEIQAAIYKLGHKTPANLAFNDIRFIPLNEALELTLHPTPKAFHHWRERHNSRYPKAQIITRPGLVELNSLKRALEATTSKEEAA